MENGGASTRCVPQPEWWWRGDAVGLASAAALSTEPPSLETHRLTIREKSNVRRPLALEKPRENFFFLLFPPRFQWRGTCRPKTVVQNLGGKEEKKTETKDDTLRIC